MSDDFLPSYIVLQHKWKEEVVGETPAGVKDRPVPPSGDWLRTLLQAGLQCFDFQRSVRGTNTAVRSRHPSRASPVPFNPAERGLSYILSAPLVQFWWRSKQRASSQRSMHALSIMAVAFCCSGKYITEIKRKGSSKAISLYTWGGGLYAHKLGRKSEMFWLYANALLCMFEAKKRSVKTNIFCRLPSDPQIRHVQMYAVYLRELFVSLHSRFLFLPLSLF